MGDGAGRPVRSHRGRGRGELGCDWHTVNDAVIAYGEALIDADPDRIGDVDALGLDETLFCRPGQWRTQQWCTSIVDVAAGRARCWTLSLVAALRSPAAGSRLDPTSGARRSGGRAGHVRPYRKTFDDTLPDAVQIADPFHL